MAVPKMDWFDIDMKEFDRMYKEAVYAVKVHNAAEVQLEECRAGACPHDGREFLPNGTVDTSKPCPKEHLYVSMLNPETGMKAKAHVELFIRIGLMKGVK